MRLKPKQIFFVLFFLINTFSIFSTQQTMDNFSVNDKKYSLLTHWKFKSPLEIFYLNSEYSSPFQMISSCNYRGFIADWEVVDSKLYLTNVLVPEETWSGDFHKNVPLKKIFYSYVESEKVHAIWFTGVLKCFSKTEVVYLKIESGEVKKKQTFTWDNYYEFSRSRENNSFNSIYDEYQNYIHKQKEFKSSKKIELSLSEIKSTDIFVKNIYEEAGRIALEERLKEKEEDALEATRFFSKLSGFNKAMKFFSLIDSEKVFSLNKGPSYIVRLKEKEDFTLDYTWFILTDSNFQSTKYNWNDFIKCASEVKSRISTQHWLLNWVNERENRELRVNVYGDRGYFLGSWRKELFNETWYHAGLKGVPFCNISLFEEGKYYASLYLGKEDRRGIMTYLFKSANRNYGEEISDKLQDQTNPKELPHFNFRQIQGQIIPEYLIIQPSGEWVFNERSK